MIEDALYYVPIQALTDWTTQDWKRTPGPGGYLRHLQCPSIEGCPGYPLYFLRLYKNRLFPRRVDSLVANSHQVLILQL